jgi:predicted P-loop ATPase
MSINDRVKVINKETFKNKWYEFQEWMKKCPVEWDDTNESESLVETYKFFFGEYEIEENTDD